MKQLISAIIIVITLFSFSAIAEEPRVPAEINEENVVSMEDATQDLMNRFVLAFFGKQALQAFTPYSIDNIDSEIVELYISPFPNFFKFIGYTFFIVSILAFAISLFYLFYIIYDGIFKSQKTGDFLGTNWNRLFLILKIGISLILTVPMYSASSGVGYNGTQYLIFLTFGKSKESADVMIRDFSRDNPTLQPEVQMPKSYASARSIADSLLDFSMCINENSHRTPNGKKDISFEEYILGGNYNVLASMRNCKVLLSFPINEPFMNTINSHDLLSTYFESSYSVNESLFPDGDSAYYSYASALTRSYRELVEKMLLDSSKIMNAYMHNTRKIKHGSLSDALNDFEFSEFLAENRGNENWHNLCPIFYNKISNLDSISDFESLFIRVMGGNCLSYDLMSAISLPNDQTQRDLILNNNRDFYLLCSNQNLVNNTLTNFDNSCLQTYCGNLEGNFTQSYLCAYTLNVFDTMRKQSTYDSLGFLVFGATIYDRFSNINPQRMKDLLNNVNATFRNNSRFGNRDVNSARSNNSYLLSSISLEVGNENYSYFSSFSNRRIVSGVDYPVNIPPLIEDSAGRSVNNFDNTLTRVNSCVKNPLSFQDGFVCGSVIQEINKMGLSMISIFTEYQTGKIIGNRHRMVSRRASGSSVGSSLVAQLQTKVLDRSIVRTMFGVGITKLIGDAVSFDDEEDFDHSGSGINDLFTYNNETNFATNFVVDFSNEYLRPNSVSFLGYISGVVGFESGILKFILYKFLVMGILIAFFIPLIPFWIFTVAAINILSMMIIKVYSLAFMAAFIMKPSRDHNNNALHNFTATFFEILFKIPFLIIGLISSWLLTNILISKIIIILDFDNLLFVESTSVMANSFYALIFSTLYAFVYLFIFLKFISLTVGMINNFESLSTSLIKGSKYNFQPSDKMSELFRKGRGYIYYGANIQNKARQANRNSSIYNNRDKNEIKRAGEDIVSDIRDKAGHYGDALKDGGNSLKEKLLNKKGGIENADQIENNKVGDQEIGGELNKGEKDSIQDVGSDSEKDKKENTQEVFNEDESDDSENDNKDSKDDKDDKIEEDEQKKDDN